MGFFIVESLNGMGMHGADIPPPVMLKQMKVSWCRTPEDLTPIKHC